MNKTLLVPALLGLGMLFSILPVSGGPATQTLGSPTPPSTPTVKTCLICEQTSPGAQTATASSVVHAVLFWSSTCPHCQQVVNYVLPPLRDKYGSRLDVRMFELSNPANAQLFRKAAEAMAVSSDQVAVPFLIIGDRILVGSVEIQQQLPTLIDKLLLVGGVALPPILGLEQSIASTPSMTPTPITPTATNTPTPTPVTPAAGFIGCTIATPCPGTTPSLTAGNSLQITPKPTPSINVPAARAVMFWMEGCPHCEEVIQKVLPPLEDKYRERLDVRLIEVKTSQDVDRLYQTANALGVPSANLAVPLLVIGDRVLIGSVQIPAELPDLIERYLAVGGVEFPNIPGWEDILPASSSGPVPIIGSSTMPEKHILDMPFVGAVNLDDYSLTVSTLLIGFLDGVNPCSLWVISLLLALVVNTGSRKKTLLVGMTFLTVAAALYALIILGLFSVFAFIGYALWIRIIVALIALTFAVVNIKDYFWYKEGLSFTISDENKPKIYRGIRSVLAPNQSSFAMIGATATMAAGVTLIEMPCTAGLPLLWTKLISANNVGVLTFAVLLGLYLLMYLLDEMFVFGSVVVTLRASRLEEKQGRVLKLVGGVVMLALALVLLVDPTLMDSISNSMLVFAGSFVAALVILVVHRRILPRWGIVIGSEDLG